jgi:Cu/Ag efflux protein CusF
MKHALTLSLIAAALTTPALAQQNAADHSSHAAHQAAPAAASALSDGEIRKVDRDAQKITIRQVRDPALLDRAKTGDKVKFSAEKSGGAYIVTRIESAK